MHTHTDAEAGSLKGSEADKVNSGYSISPCFQRWTWRSYLTEENKLIKAIQKGQSIVSSTIRHKSDVHMVNRFTVKAKVETAFRFYFCCVAFRFFFPPAYIYIQSNMKPTHKRPSWRRRMEDSSVIKCIYTLSDWFIVLSPSVCVWMY